MEHTCEKEAASLDSDRPIARPEDDLLERSGLVTQLANVVRNAPREDGFVVGLTGPWGSGKTSILHLLAGELGNDVIIVRFEPWLFSSTDQLVVRFFDELAASLVKRKGKRIKKAGQKLAEYGAAVSPVASVLLGPAGELAGAPQRILEAQQGSVADRREDLREALKKSERRIVVLVDDIDRLDAREVGEIMRLVKLVADLPGVVHVLSYDRARVQKSLERVGHEDGRAFLEKIVQVSIAVPPAAPERVRDLTLEWLGRELDDRLVAWDPSAWGRLVEDGLERYLVTLRDGRRWCNVAPAVIDLCADEVASMDVLALEAMRVFDPDVHEQLIKHVKLLTGHRTSFDFRSEAQIRDARQKDAAMLLERSSHPDATAVILRVLFPPAADAFGGSRETGDSQWRISKRVASRPVLLRYLHLSLATSEVPSATVDEALADLAAGDSFARVLVAVDDRRLDDLLERVRARVGEAEHVDVIGCARAALDAVPRLDTRRGLLQVEATRRATWFVESLLSTLPDISQQRDAARAIVAAAPTLSLRVNLLYRFRVPPEPSSKPDLDLLEAPDFEVLRQGLADEVVALDPAILSQEDALLWLLEETHAVAPEQVQQLLELPEVLKPVLERAGTRVHPITDGGVSLHLEPLFAIGGEGLPAALDQLTSDEQFEPEVRTALVRELKRGGCPPEDMQVDGA